MNDYWEYVYSVNPDNYMFHKTKKHSTKYDYLKDQDTKKMFGGKIGNYGV